MKKATQLITMGILSLICLVLPYPVKANSLAPAINQAVLKAGSTHKYQITFENTTNKEIFVFPEVYSYDPRNNQLIDKNSYIFVRTDIDSFKVEVNGKLKLNYEIVVPSNLVPGTYFNLIILKQTNDSGILSKNNTVGATENLSQLVVLHITDPSNVLGITTEFAQINMTIIDRGIPFIAPTKIKYTYQNITNYVLSPDGEIQLYNEHGKYQPVYVKINAGEKKLYPNESMEETITIRGWHFSDLLFPRTFVGRFYNGIDENYILKEVKQNASYILIISGVVVLALGFFFLKSIREDKEKKKAKT